MASRGARFKRAMYWIHRWTGVGACVLMALWFVSGVVMLFVGYPKLTPWERLERLPALSAQHCCAAFDVLASEGITVSSAREFKLTTIGGAPAYRVLFRDGSYGVFDAVTGARRPAVDERAAILAAGNFVAGAAMPGLTPARVPAHYLGMVKEDTWTHSGALNAHRPLHQVQLDDADNTRVYVSSTTGEVVLDAPLYQRAWNYVGAWLHWLYLFRDRPVDPVWSWLVIVLSGVGVVSATTGTVVGIWRWRFSGRYKSGSRSPYRDGFMYWHHIIGLAFAALVWTWIFSGLMSMNPGAVFTPSGPRPDMAAYREAAPDHHHLAPAVVLPELYGAGFTPVELEWKTLAGTPFVLARNAANQTRLVLGEAGALEVLQRWPDSVLRLAMVSLLHAPIATFEQIDRYDAYYYARQPEAMMGASERRLPALKAQFEDPGATTLYVDVYTGDVALSLARSQRVGRWLFSFLHSWDLPSMLDSKWRDALLILFSVGGLAVCVTGIKIGWSRIRRSAKSSS